MVNPDSESPATTRTIIIPTNQASMGPIEELSTPLHVHHTTRHVSVSGTWPTGSCAPNTPERAASAPLANPDAPEAMLTPRGVFPLRASRYKISIDL